MPTTKDCSICDNSLGNKKKPEITTTCGHRFHRKCVEEHIKTENSHKCPDCRKKNGLSNIDQESSSSSSEDEQRYLPDKDSKKAKKRESSSSSEEEQQRYVPEKNTKKTKKQESSRSSSEEEQQRYSPEKNERDDRFNTSPSYSASYSQPVGDEWTCKSCEYDNEQLATVCTNCNVRRENQTTKEKKTASKSAYKKSDYGHSVIRRGSDNDDDDDDEKENEKENKHKAKKDKHPSKDDAKSKSSSKKEKPSPQVTKRSIPVYITVTDLPTEYNDDEKLEDHIHRRIKGAVKIDVIKVKYYSQIGVGVVYVQSNADKDHLINGLGKLTWKAKEDQSFISFEDTIDFASYVVLDEPDDKIDDDDLPTAEDVQRQWKKSYGTEKPSVCVQLTSQFPNIYRVVTRSLEELVANLEQTDIVIKDCDAQVYFCSNCSYFEDLPKSITKNQLVDAINKAIQPVKFSTFSFHIQLNKKTATACVIAVDAVRQWSTLSYIELNNKTFSKKNSLSCRLVVQPVPADISVETLLQNPIFRGKAKKVKLLGDTLILEVSDQGVYDGCIEHAIVRIDGQKKARMKLYNPTDHATGNEIDGETWYDVEMGKYDADIGQFTSKFDQEIFRLRWNAKIWREQFENAAPENYRFERGQRGQDRRGMRVPNRRNLLQMTVMLNTLAAIKDRKYFLQNREIPLNLNKTMKTIVYNHRSKLIKSFPMPIRSLPFKQTKVHVVNQDCVAAHKTLLKSCKNPLLLNMANSKTPGGGYRKGENAQEENLFRRSDYYRSIDTTFDSTKQLPPASERFRCTNECQIEPLPTPHKMYPIDEFGAIYTTGLTIFRHSQDVGYEFMEEPLINVTAIAVAAFRDPKVDGDYLDNESAVGTRKKIETIFAIAHNQRHDSLVLSAFGCGAFHNPPGHIAQIFQSVIEQYAGYFDTILFAILDDHNTGQEINPHGNFKPFADLFNGKTFSPAKSMDKPNTKHGSYRISTDGSFVYDVCIHRENICSKGAKCSDIFEKKHATEQIHPPMCNYAALNGRCDLKSDRVHMSSYIHSRMCSYGGQCERIKDEKHCQEFSHPSNCSDGGNCINMKVNHLKEFLHLPLCKDGPKCMQHKKHDENHCQSYRHCKRPCQFEGQCVNFHDHDHINEFGHPFTVPCSLTPFHCRFYTTLSEAIDPKKCDPTVQEHCLDFSHVCRFGRNCTLDSTIHQINTIHIIRRLCPHGEKCKKLYQEEHLNSYSHPKLADIRRLCQYGSRCYDLHSLDHVTKFRHARTDENMGVVQLYQLNVGLNFAQNQCENIRLIRAYVKKQGWKPLPDDGIPRSILDYFRTVQPVHRCSPFIFESILLHGHVMSRDYMENLKKIKFVATSVMQHSRVRRIDSMNIPQYNKAAYEYIIEIVRQEFAAANFPPPDHAPTTTTTSSSHPSRVNPSSDEYSQAVKSMYKIVNKTFSKTDIEVMKKKAIEIAQASIKLHSNPAGIGHAPDRALGTHKRVFSILGPHLGHYYGDVFLVFKREILHHPDADFSMCAATTFGSSGNAYKWRPWLTDPGNPEERIKHYHRTKLHASTPGFEYAIALELMAITSLQFKLNSMDLDLDKLFQRWISVDSHHNIEGHLPQLIPIDYIDHIYVAQNIYDTFTPQTMQSLNAVFKNRYTIMEHQGLVSDNPIGSAGPIPADKERADYQKAVVEQLMKQYTHNIQYGASRPVQGTAITIPATNLDKCFSLPLTISQAYDLYTFEKGHDPTENIAYIYWQTINGDMMLVLSKDPITDDEASMKDCLLCYISPKCDSHDHNYHEQATYIHVGEPIQHHKFVKKHKFKAHSNRFHIGSNADDYITYCLEIHRSKGRVILHQAGSNAIYNYEQITCDLSSKELNLSELEYISITSDTKEVSVRNLFVSFERQTHLHPTFDDEFKKAPSKTKTSDDSHVAGSSLSSSSAVVQCCPNNVNCVIQYMTDADAKAHLSKYSHPCRFSELCRNKEPHLTHDPHHVPKCKNDGHCNKLGDPYHRADYRHTDLPDFLVPCRTSKCSDKSDNHLTKYSHGEEVYRLKESSKSASKTSEPVDTRPPCQWGTKCKDIADGGHRAKYSHKKSDH